MTDHNPDLPVYQQYNCPHSWPWKRFEVAGDWIAGTVRDSGPDCIHVDTINGLVAIKPPRRTAWQVSEPPPSPMPPTP